MLAKPEKNVRSAFTTSTVVRMHVGDAKKAAKSGKPSSSMANLFRRRGSAHDIRYTQGPRLTGESMPQVLLGYLNHFSYNCTLDACVLQSKCRTQIFALKKHIALLSVGIQSWIHYNRL